MDDDGAGDVHDEDVDGVGLFEGSGAGEPPRVPLLGPDDAQSVLQGVVPHGALGPALGIGVSGREQVLLDLSCY